MWNPLRGGDEWKNRRDVHRRFWDSDSDDPALRGGLSVTLVGDDGVRYYASHLRAINPGIEAGTRVEAGQPFGEVGDTGNAAGTGCHAHFGISPPCGSVMEIHVVGKIGRGRTWIHGVTAPTDRPWKRLEP